MDAPPGQEDRSAQTARRKALTDWTNEHDIDEAIATAIRNDPYEKVGDISVTGLLKPPQIAGLELLHKDEVTRDVTDGLWILLGRAMHNIVAEAKVEGSIEEHRLTTEIEGWTVSGAFDRWYANNALVDYKCTSVWAYIYGGRDEWKAQLNMYAYLAHVNDLPVDTLKIVAIFRDHNRRLVKPGDNYPPHPFGEIEYDLWPWEFTADFMAERVRLHQAAREGRWPACTDSDRWARPDKWAVQKPGAKRAYRLFDSQFNASDFAQTKPGYQVVHRKGQAIRCESFCPVLQWCDQARAMGVEIE